MRRSRRPEPTRRGSSSRCSPRSSRTSSASRDPAGGFLVEAARRIIDATGGASPKELGEALAAIAGGLYGGEISPFPYYLTEINLLLQVSRLLGRMRVAGIEPQPVVLGVVRTDSVGTMSTPAASFDVGTALRADHAELVHNIYDVFPVLLLAIEKLRPGGRLCVITPEGWMNAGNADFLRERLASELTLEQLFLFGSYRLFADEQGPAQTPLVESAILVATKSPAARSHKLCVVALEEAAASHGYPDVRRRILKEDSATPFA